jgi:methionyl-tRNA formyltransferase
MSAPDEELRPAPKIFKETCHIDWSQPAKRVYDFVRGLSPYPAAWTQLRNASGEEVVVKVFETEKLPAPHSHPVGTQLTDGKHYLRIAVPDGYIGIKSLQLPGKKRLAIEELLRGYKFAGVAE